MWSSPSAAAFSCTLLSGCAGLAGLGIGSIAMRLPDLSMGVENMSL